MASHIVINKLTDLFFAMNCYCGYITRLVTDLHLHDVRCQGF